jgi:hypothetical protein
MRETLRYLNNAKEISKSVPIEDITYTDIKPVQEACGTAYLAVLKAVDGHLLKKGVDEKELSESDYSFPSLQALQPAINCDG